MNVRAQYRIGMDVGGSHISCGIVDVLKGKIINKSVQEIKINSDDSIERILNAFERVIEDALSSGDYGRLSGVGVAMPGPFDYRRGISQISGVQKFDSIYGLNLKYSIQNIVGKDIPVVFENDAACFALGEYYAGAAKGSNRSLVVTLGTGFGSTFLVDGKIQTEEDAGVPVGGYLYNMPFKNGIADDYFSTRWFIARWRDKTGENVRGAKDIAELAKQNDKLALEVFDEFIDNLVEAVYPWLEKFQPDVWVFGGSIAKAADLFLDPLRKRLQNKNLKSVEMKACTLWDEAAMIGAAMNVEGSDKEISKWRKTEQYLAPTKAEITQKGRYDIYPAFPVGDNKIKEGSGELAKWIAEQKTVVIDGYVGVFWDRMVQELSKEPTLKDKKVRWFHADAAMKSADEIGKMIKPYMGEVNSIFGKITDKNLKDWFYMDKLIQIKPDAEADINILVGCGAALAGWDAKLIYVDLPKNELQFRMRAGVSLNLG
ncbi:MAG: ROK family protein, partial [Prevotellaceae bacterium]|nr:ROK family protein [Prevotellaceae bacterium]